MSQEKVPRDYVALLARVPFWDVRVSPRADDSILQSKAELAAFCAWIERHHIRSYIEIGIWTGKLLVLLTELFEFEKVGGCDLRAAEKRGLTIKVPQRASMCWGEAGRTKYNDWRRLMGKVDLCFIDADHSYGGVRADFERERNRARFLAFHDIANLEHAPGVVRLWKEIGGFKREIVVPRPSEEGGTMGIGIWSDKERP